MAPTHSSSSQHRFDIALEDLQTFIAVAEAGGFSRAAKTMNLSQPSISNRVRRLEEKVRTRLLDRTTRSVELTVEGRRLYLQASATLNGLHELLCDFHAEAAAREREVNVAATVMVASLALTPIIGAFQRLHPTIAVTLRDVNSGEALIQVGDGRCDLAVMVMSKPREGIVFEEVLPDPCVVVTPLDHPLLRASTARLADVLAYPLLSPDSHGDLRQAIVAEAEPRELTLKLSPEARPVRNTVTLLAMAAAGLGVCIHQRSFIPNELKPTVGIVPLADCEIVRTFGIATADTRELSRSARIFRDFLRIALASGPEGWTRAASTAVSSVA